jgi:5-methylcytosine-specific restriction protein A
LIPLCATCHHVVHSRNPPYTVAEIRAPVQKRGACSVTGTS